MITLRICEFISKTQAQVFNAFGSWKAMVENETSLKMKNHKTKNDGEY